jgi:RNA polymerase sigma-70 factor (ECF subfamily)
MTTHTLDTDETQLIEALRRRDESAFMALVEQYNASLLRLAQMYVADRAAAEEVVQDTWLGVLKGIDRFEGRSSFKTWLYRILTNTAKTRGVRESRSIPFSAMWNTEAEPFEPAVDANRFEPPDDPHWLNHWAVEPQSWGEHPEERLLARETLAYIRAAIEALPPAQREVITLRDVEGWSSEEVRNALEISETNQRVLLHRARSKVRAALEKYLDANPS